MKQLKDNHFWIWAWVTLWLALVFIGLSVYLIRTGAENARLGKEVAATSEKLEKLTESISKLHDASVRVRTLIEFYAKQEKLMLEWNERMAPAWVDTLEILTDKEKMND